ncbi:SpoIIE family protein phosphatase [Nonomuraea diastatica]|uniref:protein-serine/threonine phosphatase n=1 Tax=Nonomuraea diastatica TaxID=1848329 RepID=A0A4R4WDE3_9ACTN|nr:SpoIIE family protein phosphatase [Nonomuraea diastatica]TDD13395.1 PAS domain-containing protein [Nonomuraea diastatica]
MAQSTSDGQGRWWATQPEFWREVFDHLGAGVAVLDSSDRIIAVNPAAEELLDRTASAMSGQNFHDLLHRHADDATLPDQPCRLLTALTRHIRAREVDRFLGGDGYLTPVIWFSDTVTRNGEVLGMTVLFTGDATDREAADDLAAHVTALADLTDRLALVAEIATALAQTLDTEEALARLGRLLVPRLADWVAIDLRTDEGIQRVAVIGPEGRDAEQEAWRGPLPALDQHSRSSLVRVLHGGEPVLMGPGDIAPPPDSPLAAVQTGFLQALGATSAVIVPLGTVRRVTGALTLARTDAARPFDAAEVSLIGDIGRRVGLAIDNTLRFGRQRQIAEAMQRNLLTALPQPGRLRLAARYQPAPVGSQVGGDWYDAFLLRDGATALVIGDVIGHDLAAAAGMAQLHGMLRALAWDRTGPPSAIIDRLDQAVPVITKVPLATAILARIEGPDEGPWQLRWTNAGHPPPLLVTPDGRAEYLEQGQGLLLGTGLSDVSRPDATVPLPPRSTLLFYTDGLIEVPGTDLDTGMGRLRRHAAALACHPLDEFCDHVLARMPPGTADDIALLAVRIPATSDDRGASRHGVEEPVTLLPGHRLW